MENILKSQETQLQKSHQRLELDAAATSTQTGKASYSAEEALEVALIVIECLSRNMYSPDAMFLAFTAAGRRCPENMDNDKFIKLLSDIAERSNCIRKSNPLSSLF